MSQHWTANGTDAILVVDASGGAESVRLTSMATGRKVTVRRLDSGTAAVTVSVATGLTLDGVLNGTTTVGGDAESGFLSTDTGFESFGGVSLATLTGTFVSVGETNIDVAAYDGNLTAAVAAAPSGQKRFHLSKGLYTIASGLNFDGSKNVTLAGPGNLADRDQDPICEIRYTPSGTAPAISARQSQGFSIDGLAVRYSSAGYTGRLIDVTGGAAPTYQPKFRHCHLGGMGGAAVNATTVADLGNTVEARFEDAVIARAARGVIGYDGSATYATAVQFRGGRFVDITTAESIRNPHQAWEFYGTVFENATSGAPSGIVSDATHPAESLSLFGASFWDVSQSGVWIDYYGDCLSLFGCFASLGTGVTYARLNGVVNGFKSLGNYIAGNSSSVYLEGANTPDVRAAMLQDTLLNGVPYNLHTLPWLRFAELPVTPVRRYKTVTADYTAKAYDGVIFADTTSGNITITLPDSVSLASDTTAPGRELTIIKTAAANTLAVNPQGGQRLNGGFGATKTTLGSALHLICDGQAAPGGWWTMAAA